MKEFANFFTRRYSAVNAHDDEQQQYLAGHATNTTNPAILMQRASMLAEKQRRKSLKAQRSVNPAGILSSFFNERTKDHRARSPKCAFLLLAIGVLAITTAVLVKIFQPYDMIFKYKLVMEDDGEIFNLWAQPPIDLYIKIYLFNVTNAEAFLAGHEQLRVEQVGPYVYKEIMTHENITFNENNTMSATPSHPLVWQEHLSEGHKEDDEVVMLNIAMLAISHLTAPKPYLYRMALNTLFLTSNSVPIVRMTAKQFMFGYPSSLTTLGNRLLPNWISFEKVGLIDRMYDFASDYETFYTGASNPAISGLYATYRGDTNLPQWNDEHCSNIELASDGTKFRSFLQANESVKFFRKSMCRPIKLHRQGEQLTFGSLQGYRYVFEENAFDNGAINEKNKCYCRKGHCQPQGLIDVTDCYYGFPISLSYPHFMNGDPGLVKNVTGMEPDPAKHSTAFVIQPESGLPLSLSVKVQINMHFNDLRSFNKVSRFSHLTAPMLWFEIMMPQLPDALDTRFNFYLNILPYIDIVGYWGGLVLGIAFLVYAVTRATLRMGAYAQAGNISDSKYCKANILRSAGGSVYNPCEMKLLHTNEKPMQPSLASRQHLITRNDCEDDDTQTDAADIMYREINRDRSQSFALELEPAIDDDDDDEGNESDTATLSRNSTSSSCMDEQADEYNGNVNAGAEVEKETSISYGSSGFVSSLNGGEEDNAQNSSNSSSWSMNGSNSGANVQSPTATAMDTLLHIEESTPSTSSAQSATQANPTASASAPGNSRRIYDV